MVLSVRIYVVAAPAVAGKELKTMSEQDGKRSERGETTYSSTGPPALRSL